MKKTLTNLVHHKIKGYDEWYDMTCLCGEDVTCELFEDEDGGDWYDIWYYCDGCGIEGSLSKDEFKTVTNFSKKVSL